MIQTDLIDWFENLEQLSYTKEGTVIVYRNSQLTLRSELRVLVITPTPGVVPSTTSTDPSSLVRCRNLPPWIILELCEVFHRWIIYYSTKFRLRTSNALRICPKVLKFHKKAPACSKFWIRVVKTWVNTIQHVKKLNLASKLRHPVVTML